MKNLRILIRKILSAREYESIEDALLRKKSKLRNIFIKQNSPKRN